MRHEDYKLIPFNDISDDARKIAVDWFEYKPMGFDLHNRHKLASDIMNYSNVQLAEYKTKLKKAISNSIDGTLEANTFYLHKDFIETIIDAL